MNLYVDASALVKRYVAEPDSQLVRSAMEEAEGWFICRIGYLETVRAVGTVAGRRAVRAVDAEWASFGVIEVDERLTLEAAELALRRDLRSLDALHLAAALLLPREDLTLTSWDRRLRAAAEAEGLRVLP